MNVLEAIHLLPGAWPESCSKTFANGTDPRAKQKNALRQLDDTSLPLAKRQQLPAMIQANGVMSAAPLNGGSLSTLTEVFGSPRANVKREIVGVCMYNFCDSEPCTVPCLLLLERAGETSSPCLTLLVLGCELDRMLAECDHSRGGTDRLIGNYFYEKLFPDEHSLHIVPALAQRLRAMNPSLTTADTVSTLSVLCSRDKACYVSHGPLGYLRARMARTGKDRRTASALLHSLSLRAREACVCAQGSLGESSAEALRVSGICCRTVFCLTPMSNSDVLQKVLSKAEDPATSSQHTLEPMDASEMQALCLDTVQLLALAATGRTSVSDDQMAQILKYLQQRLEPDPSASVQLAEDPPLPLAWMQNSCHFAASAPTPGANAMGVLEVLFCAGKNGAPRKASSLRSEVGPDGTRETTGSCVTRALATAHGLCPPPEPVFSNKDTMSTSVAVDLFARGLSPAGRIVLFVQQDGDPCTKPNVTICLPVTTAVSNASLQRLHDAGYTENKSQPQFSGMVRLLVKHDQMHEHTLQQCLLLAGDASTLLVLSTAVSDPSDTSGRKDYIHRILSSSTSCLQTDATKKTPYHNDTKHMHKGAPMAPALTESAVRSIITESNQQLLQQICDALHPLQQQVKDPKTTTPQKRHAELVFERTLQRFAKPRA